MLELYIGQKRTRIVILPDTTYPQMWRVQWPDGKLSEMVNKARAKNAALRWANMPGSGVTFS